MSRATTESTVAPLDRGGAAEQIIADLQDQILRGKLPRGSKLPTERMLAAQYRVSGATIREALRGLAAIKLVEPRHGAGTFVTADADAMFAATAAAFLELKKVGLLDILDVFETLLEKVSVLACQNADDAELANLSQLLERLENATAGDAFTGHLADFLGALADASHNLLLASLSKLLIGLLIEIVREQPGGVRIEVVSKLRTDRRRLVEALIDRDAKQAARFVARYHAHTRSLVSPLLSPEGGGKDHDRMRHAYRRLRRGS